MNQPPPARMVIAADPAMELANAPLLADLRRRVHAMIRSIVDPSKPVCLVDYPSYGNPGDNAIWLGQTRVLSEVGLDVAGLIDLKHFSARALHRRIGRGTILLQGGGNFGDVYPQHQALRERIISEFPGNPIVQLPQSIHFADRNAIIRSARCLARHPDFTLVTRDLESHGFAETTYSCKVLLCPDSAFALDHLAAPRREPQTDVLWLSRVDPERRFEPPAAQPDVHVTDWYTGLFHRRRWRIEHALRRAVIATVGASRRLRRLEQFPAARLLDPLAMPVLRSGLEVLSTGRVVVTDRLHVHILCLLLGKPHVILDNSYGKLGRFHRTWTSNAMGVATATEVDDALTMARALVLAEQAGAKSL